MTDRSYDVVVVGAGPAGSTSAALLAERGFRVALVDRATLPRPKPCAEYVSPAAARILDRLLPPGRLEAAKPAWLGGMRVVSSHGTAFTGRFVPGGAAGRGAGDHRGVALPRETLDSMLVEAAVRRGATLIEATAVQRADPDGDRRVVGTRSRGGESSLSGRLVVAADGLNSRIARRLGLARRGRLRRVALVTHLVGVEGMSDVGEMHVAEWGYVGLAPVGGGLTNLSVVVGRKGGKTERRQVRGFGGPDEVPAALPPFRRSVLRPGEGAAEWLASLVATVPEVAERVRDARRVSPVRAVGPFAHRSVRATADRVVLVGDAADFYDPFTGDGIFAALRGAEILAPVAADALESDRLSETQLAPYDAARRREFGGKWILERIVAWVVGHAPALDHVAGKLARRAELADLLVSVTGHLAPARRVLAPAFAWQVLS
jgi:flavin-dependent dehydrogenase